MTLPERPPVARPEPFEHTEHGVARPDPYRWLADIDSPEVLSHLAAERAWYDASCAHLNPLVATLRAEMVSRVQPTEVSPRRHRRAFSYYSVHPAGKDYARLMREIRDSDGRAAADSVEEIAPGNENHGELLLDVNDLLGPSGYVALGVVSVSPDERLLAYSVDAEGDEVFALGFRDLATGTDLPEVLPRTYYGAAWSSDSAFFFYTVHDEAYRPFQVWRHRVGTDPADDVLVLAEPDERFEVNVRGTRSGELVVIWSESNSTSEVWVLPSDAARTTPRSVGGRRHGVRYHAEHRRWSGGSDLLIVTNDDAVEFRVMTAPLPPSGGQDHTAWTPGRPEDPADRVERIDAFAAGLVLHLRSGGEHLLRLLPHDRLDAAGTDIVSAFPGGEVYLDDTPSYDATAMLIQDESRVQPAVWSTVDLVTGARTVVHREQAPGFDPGDYLTERRTFPSADGTLVPATVIRHRDTPLDGTAPALVYGYGSYEAVFEPEWDAALPSLLDRGVVYAYAHLRGGGELGRHWYLDGKLGRKQHTFDDQIAVADGLADAGLVDPARIATRGLSAGGLLQGAVFSQRPDRWCAVLAEVPFVDVVTTMFDSTTPLTATEWEEWGDPRIREEFDWMLAYSPYDNLPSAGSRPPLLVTGAVHDPRVMVREPAKWVAALRATDPEWSAQCLFRCETGAGAHVGPSGRFGHLAYEAEVYAWLLDRFGLAVEEGS